jgi:hypothetical protein
MRFFELDQRRQDVFARGTLGAVFVVPGTAAACARDFVGRNHHAVLHAGSGNVKLDRSTTPLMTSDLSLIDQLSKASSATSQPGHESETGPPS